MKRHLISGSFMLLLFLIIGCNTPGSNKEICHIYGTTNGRFEGVKIFLVPMNEPAVAETVDSVTITDGKFAFQSETGKMKSLRLDYRHRIGVEELLVITEPGDLHVVIDSISSGRGTPQNDSLQLWKEYTASHYKNLAPFRKAVLLAKQAGDTLLVEEMKSQMKSLETEYKHYSRRMAANLKEGVLHDFLNTRFPTSYKKQMPDGEIVTIELE